ncbi:MULTISPECIES: paeninodin family lasso peptide [unclassified Exiguobacterium]|nr:MULTISPECIES: paeninodin family lasso peptide [unclassified Exiguobacterium]
MKLEWNEPVLEELDVKETAAGGVQFFPDSTDPFSS